MILGGLVEPLERKRVVRGQFPDWDWPRASSGWARSASCVLRRRRVSISSSTIRSLRHRCPTPSARCATAVHLLAATDVIDGEPHPPQRPNGLADAALQHPPGVASPPSTIRSLTNVSRERMLLGVLRPHPPAPPIACQPSRNPLPSSPPRHASSPLHRHRRPSQPSPPHQGRSILAVPRPLPSCVSPNRPLVSSPNHARPTVSRRRARSPDPATQSSRPTRFRTTVVAFTRHAQHRQLVSLHPTLDERPTALLQQAHLTREVWEDLDVGGVIRRLARHSGGGGGGLGVRSVIIGALYALFYSTRYLH